MEDSTVVMTAEYEVYTLAEINEAVDRALIKAKVENVLENRHIVLAHMLDWWLENEFQTPEGKLIMKVAHREMMRIRERLPEQLRKVPVLP